MKINIKGKILVKTKTEIRTIPLAIAKQYGRKSCGFCDDFSSELADISAGGLGLDGWTFTIIRTERGEELFSGAEKAGYLNVKAVDEETYALIRGPCSIVGSYTWTAFRHSVSTLPKYLLGPYRDTYHD